MHRNTEYINVTYNNNNSYLSVIPCVKCPCVLLPYLHSSPIVIDIHGHRFQIFTLVSEIHENVDLVLYIKNIFELEGIINSQESCFSFLNRSIQFFPKEQITLKPKEQQFIKIEAPFMDNISGLAIVNMLPKKAQNMMMFKLKFV